MTVVLIVAGFGAGLLLGAWLGFEERRHQSEYLRSVLEERDQLKDVLWKQHGLTEEER